MKELGRIAREGEAPRDDAEARELLRPFSPEELEAMAAGATRELLGEPAKAEGRAATKARARWGGPMTIGAFVLAAAAAVILWVRTAPPVSAPLASYELVVEGGERPSRSGDPASDAEPVKVRRDGRLVLVARPRTALPAGASAGVVAMIARGDTLREWHVTPQISAEGAIRIEAAAAALAELPDGASRVVLFVGPPAALPSGEEAARASRRAPARDLQTLERDLFVVAP